MLRYSFLIVPSLFLHFLPCLISNCLNLPFVTQGLPLRAQLVKILPATEETPVQSLGWEDPLVEKYCLSFSISIILLFIMANTLMF